MRNHETTGGANLGRWMAGCLLAFGLWSSALAGEGGARGANASSFTRDAPEWQVRLELARILSYDKQYDDSIAQYQRVLAANPDLTGARLEMAHVLYWAERTDEAFAILSAMAADELTDREKRVLADLHAARDDYEAALELYRELRERFPDDLTLRFKIAELLSWSKQYNEALAEFEALVALDPDDVYLRRRYAEVLHWAGRHREAARQLQSTLPQ